MVDLMVREVTTVVVLKRLSEKMSLEIFGLDPFFLWDKILWTSEGNKQMNKYPLEKENDQWLKHWTHMASL